MSPHWQPFLSLRGISNNIRNSSRQSTNDSSNENRTSEIFNVKQNEEYGGKKNQKCFHWSRKGCNILQVLTFARTLM